MMATKIELPTLLSYPKILDLDEVPEMSGHLIYVLKYYVENGISFIIKRIPEEDAVVMVPGDFDGNLIQLDSKHKYLPSVREFLSKYSTKVVTLMRYVGITQAQYYLSVSESGEMRLVDIRLSLNKFTGPGMIYDLFKNVLPTQELITVIHLNDDALAAIKAHQGQYAGSLMLKTSLFKTIDRTNEVLPAYARLIQK